MCVYIYIYMYINVCLLRDTCISIYVGYMYTSLLIFILACSYLLIHLGCCWSLLIRIDGIVAAWLRMLYIHNMAGYATTWRHTAGQLQGFLQEHKFSSAMKPFCRPKVAQVRSVWQALQGYVQVMGATGRAQQGYLGNLRGDLKRYGEVWRSARLPLLGRWQIYVGRPKVVVSEIILRGYDTLVGPIGRFYFLAAGWLGMECGLGTCNILSDECFCWLYFEVWQS